MKLEQRYDDLRSSVVALNYQSTLLNSPEIINNEIPMQNSNKNLLRRKSSIIDFAPITNFKKRNTIVFNKLNEIEEFMDERTPQGWVQNENINFGGDSLSVKTKKKLFEEFALLGIDKKDLLKIDKQNLEKGYLEPQVIYDFPPNNEWFFFLLSLNFYIYNF